MSNEQEQEVSNTTPPLTAFNFEVQVTAAGPGDQDELCRAAFAECDGLEMTMEPKSIREGGRNTGPVHLTGPVSYGQLTLKRGMTAGFDLWEWFERINSRGERGLRADVVVSMLGPVPRATEGQPQRERPVEASFTLTGCVPTRVRGPALNAKDGLIAIEEMQLAYESMTLKMPDTQATG